jgi:CarboxypepD_reg-like domain
MRSLLFILLSLPFFAIAQLKTGTISGIVIDEDDRPIEAVSVEIINKQQGTKTNANGTFTLKIPSNKFVAVSFKAYGFASVQNNYIVNVGQEKKLLIKLIKKTSILDTVVVKTDAERRNSGSISIDASKSHFNPSPINSIESLLKFFVGSNSELTSQYSVRGGSYDENIIYVNDFEIYRPYLIRNGQQEGLSFINPDLTGNVKFYVGGFQAKYGDKMSSVLDITYKKPKKFAGSAYIGLLEQGLHIEGTSNNNKLTYLFGIRNRSNRNLVSSQETKGNYIPSSTDLQALFTYQITKKWQMELFVNTSSTNFTLIPEEAKLTTSVFTPLFSSNLGLDIAFEGIEKDAYSTNFIGISSIHQPKKNVKLKWMLSAFNNFEQENIDITSSYLFGDRSFDKSQANYGLIVNPLGAGVFQNYARNSLDIAVISAQHKGSLDSKKHHFQWGLGIDKQLVTDKLNEWKYNDSAGYSLPFTPNILQLNSVIKSQAQLDITRINGYWQDNIIFKDSSDFVMNVGVRFNYNSLNNQFLFSPRVGISFKPKHWEKNVIFKASFGAYHQPPFYRELRKLDGSLNTNLLAQQSWQFSTGMDYNFKFLGRPARLTSELYYKSMTSIVPYDIDNVRVKYFGENSAKAYAVGLETRLYAEIVKDAESWVSIGIMKTKEEIDNFTYTNYYNALGQLITNNVSDRVPVDSQKINPGYLRRPTDRLFTVGLFFQDYLSTNKNFKVYLSTIYGSNLPYNIPGNVKYRNALFIDSYLRFDMGFSALLLDGQKTKRRHSPFKNFESIWASLELFNVIDKANTISYLLIKDFQNNTFTIPNRLTPRMINLKLVVKW